MKKVIVGIIVLLLLVVVYAFTTNQGGENVDAPNPVDQSQFTFEPISHATFVAEFAGQTIYVDPVGGAEKFITKTQPDLILLTDTDGDHFDVETIQNVITENTSIIAPQVAYNEIPQNLRDVTTVISNGETTEFAGILFEAIPMYNLPESEDAYHVKGVGNGYVLEYEEERIYIAGDTEDTPEFRSQENIDVAFVPMNLPYTMSVESAADGVLELAPKVVYPYHYRGQDGLSDVDRFEQLVESQNPDINVILLNWYPETEASAIADSQEIKTYQISQESTVSYTAQKEFFSKPTEAITGTTSDIDGQVSINEQNQTISVQAEVNPQTLDSGSGNRDRYVRDQFDSPITITVEDVDFGSFGQTSFTGSVVLTINGISSIEEFDINGTIAENEIILRGQTEINMPEYSIEPASLAEVYTVNDVAEISFDLVANINE